MERALLIPVKELSNAKHRLAPFLSPAERRELAWLMLRGVMQAAAELPQSLRRIVVTSYAPAKELAAGMGFEVLSEVRQSSESESVDFASARLEQDGVAGVLRVPLDLPLINSADLARLLNSADNRAADQGAASIAVPSLEGTGTNALYRSPPTLFPSKFGPDSLAKHRAHACGVGVEMLVRKVPSLALDIDTPEDLKTLLETGMECPVRDYLKEIGVQERMAQAGMGGWPGRNAGQKR